MPVIKNKSGCNEIPVKSAGRKKRIVLLGMMLVMMSGWGQDNSLSIIRQKFDQSIQNRLFEKMFVHTDKTFYLVGEVIWFKLYQADGYLNQPIQISKLGYVEILSQDLKPVLQAKIAMNTGNGSGSFLIPSSFNSGNYLIRAYTNWMKNFPTEYYFQKQITIVNPLKRPDWKPLKKVEYDLQFFPEGGNLVEGLSSKVAYRIIDQQGKGVECTGVVVNQKNDTVAIIQPRRFGIGHFIFTPLTGNSYKAIIYANDSIITKNLPELYNKGYVMNMVPVENDQVKITATTNNNLSNVPVYLFVHTRHQVKLARMNTLQNGSAIFIIDKKELGDGISHFTLFDHLQQPLCERLYFKRPLKKLEIDAKTDHVVYGTKQEVKIDINVMKYITHPLSPDLSASVFLVDSLQHAEEGDIFTYLWLNSDLKGTIESPAYYSTNTKETEEAIDNLMLTHGWRRFNWNDILKNNTPSFTFLPEYEGHIVNGKLVDQKNGLPKIGTTAFLSIPGQPFQFSNAVSDGEGHVRFIVKNLYGADELIIQTKDREDSDSRIDLSSPFSEDFPSAAVTPFNLTEGSKPLLVSRSIGTQVQNTYLADSIRQFILPKAPDTTSFYGKPDKEYLLDNYTRFITMEEVLREFVSEVRLRKRQDSFHFEVRNAPYKTFFEEDPLVLVDGVPVFNIDKIVSFDPLKIKKIEVVTQRYYYGSLVTNGIVSFTTYESDLGGFKLDPGSLIVGYEGLQLQRQFYSPVYDTPLNSENRLPDFRNVLYWSPEIITNSGGKGQLSFYTSEIPGKYALFIQGITADGYAGSATITFSVIDRRTTP